MKFAFSTNAFRNFSFDRAVTDIAQAGFEGIEIMCDTPHAFPGELSGDDISAISAVLEKNNLSISNLNAFMMCAVKDFHHPSWIEEDEAFRQIRINYTIDCIDLACQLGAKTISTEPGGPLGDMSQERALALFEDGIRQVLPYAQKKDIHLLIEPEPGLLIETSDQFLSFMERFTSHHLGLNFDIGHFFCVGEDPEETVDKLKDHTLHYHLEDIPQNRTHEHIMLGTGGIDIKGVLKTIEKTGYNGFVTVELYPYLDTPGEIANLARTFLKDICGYE